VIAKLVVKVKNKEAGDELIKTESEQEVGHDITPSIYILEHSTHTFAC
jgi:hypothetical protein